MQVPLEIAFHHVDSTEWAEEQIRRRAAKLEKIYERLVACRVRVDRRTKGGARSMPPVVRIELGLPGRKDLVVSHEPDHLLQKFQAPDLHNAINEAFRIAEEQLVEFKRLQRERSREPVHEVENQHLGQVAEIT